MYLIVKIVDVEFIIENKNMFEVIDLNVTTGKTIIYHYINIFLLK